MNFKKLLISSSFVTLAHRAIIIPKVCPKYTVHRKLHDTCARNMAQRSITSFFKVSPPVNAVVNNEKPEQEDVKESKVIREKSPAANGIEKKVSKRARLESSGSETEVAKSPKLTSQKNKKPKRQRIESSSSESEPCKSDNQLSPENLDIKQEKSGSPEKTNVSPDKDEVILKLEKLNKPKTYESPKTKKRKPSTLSPTNKMASPTKNQLKKTESASNDSPKKNVAKKESPERSPSPKSIVKQEEVSDGDVDSLVKNKENVKVKLETDKKDEAEDKVSESEYNPAKSKYHPIKDACWSAGQPVPYLALTQTLEIIEGTSARLKIVDTLANYFRSVIALTPDDLLPSVYLCLNQLAPAYHGLELGIAESYLMKAVGQSTGQSVSQVRAAARRAGELAAAAAAARAHQRLMFAAAPLALRKVFAALKDIAHTTGQSSMNKKINKIQTLFVACRQSEAKFLIRSLEGKLRIGLAEQSVLQALAVAVALTPPPLDGAAPVLDASVGLSPEALKRLIEEHAALIKTTYCECPNYEAVIPALLAAGARALPARCRLAAGLPLKPMLAHPTRAVLDIFHRFEGTEFTCEWKYDGERAQIHVPGGEGGPDLSRAAVFSRNQEDNTSKYPDVVRRLPALLKESVSSCVLDCEVVAYDTENKRILPFQVLSTRKRKGAVEADIKVQVCVFMFDLLLLNGEPLVRRDLRTRRQLLREHFHTVPGEWELAVWRDCSDAEQVQEFLEAAVRGGCEGLMVKALAGDAARYDIARRSHNWLKLKKDYLEGAGDSVDVVIIGAYWGRGRRRGAYGGFLAAARDPDADCYQALCRLGTGFSDADLRALSDLLDLHRIDGPRPYYRFDSSHAAEAWFAPACVWEVRCADLSLSAAHRAAIGLVDPDKGISLRFPRFVRARPDKTPEEATTAQQIAEMYLAQDLVKNQPARSRANLDDFY